MPLNFLVGTYFIIEIKRRKFFNYEFSLYKFNSILTKVNNILSLP
jgi:hypothetical protein